MKRLFIDLEVEFTEIEFADLGYGSVEEATEGIRESFLKNDDGATKKCEVRIEEVEEEPSK